jgi:hypothetical protein
MTDAEGRPSLPSVSPQVASGQQFVQALRFLVTGIPALSIAIFCRCYLTLSCVKLINLAMLTNTCCDMAFLTAFWAVGLFFHTTISVIFRIVWITKLWDCRSFELLALLKKCDAALIFCGAVWNGLGLFAALALPSTDNGALHHAIVFNGLATFITYPMEVYFFYCGLIRLRGSLDRIVNFSWARTPQSSRHKQGSLDCCAVVDCTKLGVEEVRVRSCAICLDDIHSCGKVRKTPCGHLFHESCLQGWFHQGACCPLCRMDCSTSTALQNSETEVV